MTDHGTSVLIAGIGIAGMTHLRVIERTPGLEIVAAVDTDGSRSTTFRGDPVPIYGSLHDAAAQQTPSIIVIATPTCTHAAVCREAETCFPDAAILVEKPAADNVADAKLLLGGDGRETPVTVALHMAFAPEVTWGRAIVIARSSEIGEPVHIESWSADPHQLDPASAAERLGNSWIDSGINALSVIERFATVATRISLTQVGSHRQSTFEGIFSCDADGQEVEAVVRTCWNVTDSSRSTRIKYSSGAELVLDHHAVAGYLVENGRMAEVFGSDGTVQRRDSHYAALYKWWLTENRPIFSPETSLRLHELLLSPVNEPVPHR